ncbi:hypothetical protein F2P56_035826 [Juglans regia]|uniref:Protein FAR1-RELATED SEQUENCE n=2 Tax=Juglans regia TaxID=51240 RepID=A0A833T5G1_JUGRE|nr:protein FAR1-RELATED SEQUENCE 9-like [Juglans regia]KAF5443255.1 hypothetical protein F2P56_035826 [Juglans regia]
MDAFFDGFVHSRTTLKEFIDQFDNALRKKVENEMAANFHSFNCIVPCISHLPVEKKFQEVYTNSKFKEVQTEAYFNEDECEAKCMFGLFEMRGIVCRHILSIFTARDVRELPEKYIMDRWMKDIKRRYTLVRSSYDDLSSKLVTCRYSSVIKLCYQVATNATEIEDNSIDMTQKLQTMNEIYTKSILHATVASTHTSIDAETGSSKKVLSPRVVRAKERPPSKRKQPTIEKLQTKIKKAGGK